MLLLAGCSFVNSTECHLTLFPEAHDYNKCRIVSRSGAGNKYIAHSILWHIGHLDIKKIFVLWSGLSRLDLAYSNKLNEEFSNYSHANVEEDCLWFHSGGWGGTWTEHQKNYPKSTHEYLKTLYYPQDWDMINNSNLLSIIGCLNTIENLKIPYRWGFIYDIFQDYTNTGSLGAPVDRNNPLLKMLPTHTQITTTPFEFCSQNNLLSSDGFHPTALGWSEWAKVVADRLEF
jgi:hypothetical protein